jgi:hypothetical protein
MLLAASISKITISKRNDVKKKWHKNAMIKHGNKNREKHF